MSLEVLNKITEQKKFNQSERKRLEEHFKNRITESKELGLELNPEQIYTEISNTYEYIFTLWEDVLNWKHIVAVQGDMIQLYKDISNIPTPEKRNPEMETMMKRIGELEEFQKHILDAVTNKPMPKETNQHEGMYE